MSKTRLAESGCWEWTAKTNRDGYGSFWNGEHYDDARTKPVNVLAHRWAYEFFCGPIPDGLYVCHRCDNPGCVNYRHLFVGSQKQNVHDAIDKGRHRSGRVALTDEDAEAIRLEYRGQYGDLVRLASKYGASKRAIADIVHCQRAWA